MSDHKLRVGIIGMGLYATTDHVPNFRATGRAEIVAASRAAFVSTILDGTPNIAPVEDAANVVALIQSAYRSAAERQLVRIEEE